MSANSYYPISCLGNLIADSSNNAGPGGSVLITNSSYSTTIGTSSSLAFKVSGIYDMSGNTYTGGDGNIYGNTKAWDLLINNGGYGKVEGSASIVDRADVRISAVIDTTTSTISSGAGVACVFSVTGNSLQTPKEAMRIASNGNVVIAGNLNAGTVNTGNVNITSTAENNGIQYNSGALQVAGGAGIRGNLFIGGNVNISGNVQAGTVNTGNVNITSTAENNGTQYNSGALQVAGGAGIGGNLFIGGNVNISGNVQAGTVNTGNVNITSTAENNGTQYNSGALQVAGGAGIGGNLFIGGNVNINYPIFVSNSKYPNSSQQIGNIISAGTVNTAQGLPLINNYFNPFINNGNVSITSSGVWLFSWNYLADCNVVPGNVYFGLFSTTGTTVGGIPTIGNIKLNITTISASAFAPAFSVNGTYTAYVPNPNSKYYLMGNVTYGASTIRGNTVRSASYFNAVRIA